MEIVYQIHLLKLYLKKTHTGVFELSVLLPAIILAIFSRVVFLRGKESLSVAISAFAPRLMFL